MDRMKNFDARKADNRLRDLFMTGDMFVNLYAEGSTSNVWQEHSGIRFVLEWMEGEMKDLHVVARLSAK